MNVAIMRDKIQRRWIVIQIAPLHIQAASVCRSAEHLCHASMVGQLGEGRDARHRILMRGRMDAFHSNEM